MSQEHQQYEPIPIPNGVTIADTTSYRYTVRKRLTDRHGGSVTEEAISALIAWDSQGYSTRRARPVQDAARVVSGGAEVSDVATRPEVVRCLCDVIGYCRATLRAEFGESLTVYRGVSEEFVREHVDSDRGVVSVETEQLESWTVFEQVSESFGPVTFEREVSTDTPFYFGRLIGERLTDYEEVTLGFESYEVPREDVHGYRF